MNEAPHVLRQTLKRHTFRMRFLFCLRSELSIVAAFVEMSSGLTHLPNDNRDGSGEGPALYPGLATHHLLTPCCFLPTLHVNTGSVLSPAGMM